MEVILEAYGFLGAIEEESVSREIDRRALAVIYSVVPKDL